jgi:hypothetical protein
MLYIAPFMTDYAYECKHCGMLIHCWGGVTSVTALQLHLICFHQHDFTDPHSTKDEFILHVD